MTWTCTDPLEDRTLASFHTSLPLPPLLGPRHLSRHRFCPTSFNMTLKYKLTISLEVPAERKPSIPRVEKKKKNQIFKPEGFLRGIPICYHSFPHPLSQYGSVECLLDVRHCSGRRGYSRERASQSSSPGRDALLLVEKQTPSKRKKIKYTPDELETREEGERSLGRQF